MPNYLTLPASMANRPLLVPGRPQYLWGGYSATDSPTLAYGTNIAGSGSTATLTLQLYAGKVPTTSQLITVQGCSISGFNVIGATITNVSGFNTGDNSVGTVQYANVTLSPTVAASGMVVMPVAVTSDLITQASPSLQCTMPFNDPRIDQARTVEAQVIFTSLPTTATVVLEESLDDVTYSSLGTAATVAGGVQTKTNLSATLTAGRFYRFNPTVVTGGTNVAAYGIISA